MPLLSVMKLPLILTAISLSKTEKQLFLNSNPTASISFVICNSHKHLCKNTCKCIVVPVKPWDIITWNQTVRYRSTTYGAAARGRLNGGVQVRMNGWDIWATIGAWVQATKSGESSRSGWEHGRHMWRLLKTPCSSWSGRVQINQSAHPLNVQELKALRDSAIRKALLKKKRQKKGTLSIRGGGGQPQFLF